MDEALNSIGDNKYEGYWSVLSKAIENILHSTQGTRVSFEQMYSIVYKSVCDGYSEKMHNNLLSHCSAYLKDVDQMLEKYTREAEVEGDIRPLPQQIREKERQSVTDLLRKRANVLENVSVYYYKISEGDMSQTVIFFHKSLESYMTAVQQITPIFAYMNKFYVEVSLHTSLQTELYELFRDIVADKRMDLIMASVERLLGQPFALPPAAVASLFANLHCIGQGRYGLRYPHLFSRYVVGILPPMRETDIEAHIAETRKLQDKMLAEGFSQTGMQQGLKRRGDDDNYGPTAYINASQQHSAAIQPNMFD